MMNPYTTQLKDDWAK
ncbi:Protein of unknown function [Bacillus cereus]|nr:Protein of unknown function [Bacillus cereus]